MVNKKKIGMILMFALLASSVSACGLKSADTENPTSESTSISASETKKQQNMSLSQQNELATNGCQLGKEGETITQDKLSFQVLHVEITKQKGKWTDIAGGTPKLDENNKITSAVSYVVVDTKFANMSQKEMWLNNFGLAFYSDSDRNLGVLELTSATMLEQLSEERLNSKSTFCLTAEETSDVHTKLVFVVEDELLCQGTHFFLCYDEEGLGLSLSDPKKHSMVFLESMEDMFLEDNRDQ